MYVYSIFTYVCDTYVCDTYVCDTAYVCDTYVCDTYVYLISLFSLTFRERKTTTDRQQIISILEIVVVDWYLDIYFTIQDDSRCISMWGRNA